MQIRDSCFIAWTTVCWLKQFWNMLSVEYPVLGQPCWNNRWKRCIFIALETIEVPFIITLKHHILYIHTQTLNSSSHLQNTSSNSLHTNHRSLDETVLRCILQVSARYQLVLIFVLFIMKINSDAFSFSAYIIFTFVLLLCQSSIGK